MLPSNNDVHVDALLTNLLIGYKNKKYIYNEIFPIINTGGIESDKYGIFTQADQFRNEAEVIPAGGPYPMGGFRVSSDTYSCVEIGMGTDLPDRTLANATGPFKKQLRLAKAKWVADRIEMKREISLAADIFVTGVWGTTDTTATDWSDHVNSTPITDINDAMYTIESATAETPNVLVIGNQVWKELKQNPVMLDYLGANERGIVSLGDVTNAFDLEKILVGKSIYNTANEGQTASYSNCWGSHALLLYVNQADADPFTPSSGYVFQAQPLQISTYREGSRDTEFFRGRVISGNKITGTGLGYMFLNIVS